MGKEDTQKKKKRKRKRKREREILVQGLSHALPSLRPFHKPSLAPPYMTGVVGGSGEKKGGCWPTGWVVERSRDGREGGREGGKVMGGAEGRLEERGRDGW